METGFKHHKVLKNTFLQLLVDLARWVSSLTFLFISCRWCYVLCMPFQKSLVKRYSLNRLSPLTKAFLLHLHMWVGTCYQTINKTQVVLRTSCGLYCLGCHYKTSFLMLGLSSYQGIHGHSWQRTRHHHRILQQSLHDGHEIHYSTVCSKQGQLT